MTLGLFGGTFDPIHLGHLDVARAARRALGLDAVWLVPSHVPPHRASPVASAAHRFAMVGLAVEDEDGLFVSDLEMETAGPSFTAETLDRLERGGRNTNAMHFITGADAFLEIASWKGYPAILDRCHFAVVSRRGTSAADLPARLPALAPRMRPASAGHVSTPSIFLVEATTSAVSSTDVRRALERGASEAELGAFVPSRVAAYITRNRLYPVGPPFEPR